MLILRNHEHMECLLFAEKLLNQGFRFGIMPQGLEIAQQIEVDILS